MRRREFFTVLGGAVAWPLVAHAQSAMPVVGFLHYGSANKLEDLAAAVRQGLKETGYIEGQNVTIVYRSACEKANPPLLARRRASAPASWRRYRSPL
jgi:putative ABC transport system substrate-binding protein